MNDKIVRIQVIGNYLEAIDKILKRNGIICESFISTCNPLAMTGKKDEAAIKEYEKINHLPTLLNLKKTFPLCFQGIQISFAIIIILFHYGKLQGIKTHQNMLL